MLMMHNMYKSVLLAWEHGYARWNQDILEGL